MNDSFGNWLAGFIDGEGCFTIKKQRRPSFAPAFSLRVRDDDAAILYEACRQTNLGSVTPQTVSGASKPQMAWRIYTKADCLSLISLLESYPLRGRKARDFEIWKKAVVLWHSMQRQYVGGVGRYDWTDMSLLKKALEDGRRYPAFEPTRGGLLGR